MKLPHPLGIWGGGEEENIIFRANRDKKQMHMSLLMKHDVA